MAGTGRRLHDSRSYSQCGEDRIIAYLLSRLGVTDSINYLDIGSADPIDFNNTYLFYDAVGVGVLVEANPVYRERYEAFRPKDITIAAACVPARMRQQNEITFYVSDTPGLSTTLMEFVELHALAGNTVKHSLTVPVISVNEIIHEYFKGLPIHILSIDIEGVDKEVLAEFDFGFVRPSIIAVENFIGERILDDVMLKHNYGMYAYNTINTIYVDREKIDTPPIAS